MARLICKENRLRQEYEQLKKKRNLFFLIALAAFAVFAVMTMSLRLNFGIQLLLVIAMGGCGMAGVIFSGKCQTLASGLEGEQAAARVLCRLPDSYSCYQNLRVAYDGKESEMDMVVVGPTGVFIVEVKNQNGTVLGDWEQPYWTQEKIGRKGGQYSKQLYSPVKQVGTHTWRLANWLREQNCQTYVRNAVYFSNPETGVYVENVQEKTPVFAASRLQEDQLLRYITGQNAQLPRPLLQRLELELDRL